MKPTAEPWDIGAKLGATRVVGRIIGEEGAISHCSNKLRMITCMVSRYHFLIALAVLYFMTPMNAIPSQMPPQGTRSKVDNSSIESLNSEIARLKQSASWWNNRYLLLGFLVVVVAGGAAYFQKVAVDRSRQLAEKESELSRVKESILNQNLKDKDVQIGQLGRDAEAIKADAAKAKFESDERIAMIRAEAAR